MELVPGQGHWGPDAIPGVSFCYSNKHIITPPQPPLHSNTTSIWQDARWRRGESVSLKSAREAMVSLEVAASSMLAFGAAK